MNLGKISIRYTRALYSLAVEKGAEKNIYKQMIKLSEAFFAMPKLAQALANPMYVATEKESLLANAIGKDLSPVLKQFFHFVVSKGRENLMVFMAMSYQDLFRKEQHLVQGKVTSASKLGDASISKIKKWVADVYKSELQLTDVVDSELIGGFVLEVNNYRFDASVKTRLNDVKNKLTSM